MNRRQFLQAMLAAGAAPAIVKAENLMKIWVPPAPKVVAGVDLAVPGSDGTALWRLDEEKRIIEYVGPRDGPTYTVQELYSWLKEQSMRPEYMGEAPPMLAATPNLMHLRDGWDLGPKAPEHLTAGTIISDDLDICYAGYPELKL